MYIPNQKPWITGSTRTKLKARAATFKEWDSNPEADKKSHYALRRTIKQAKREYRNKIGSYYTGSDRLQYTFRQVSIHKAAGPDGLPGCVLQTCADQLANVFTDILNMSLIESVIPTCFKQTTIVPVPKNTKVTCLTQIKFYLSHTHG